MNYESFPTEFWHLTENGRIQCDVCPRACQLKEGQRGLCFVRACEDQKIVLKTYGRSSGFCIDPVEKKPLYHFYPGTSVLSFGTAGCNLFCKFCQNWDISKARTTDRLLDQAMPNQIVKAAKKHNCYSVAYTYNDPVIFLEYAVDVAKACRDEGIKNIAVSAGYICEEPRKLFYEYMDAANIDLKAFTDDFYKKTCGGNLQSVLDTLLYLRNETDVWFEITNLIIPGGNDSAEEIDEMSQWISKNLGNDTPIHFSAFHPDYKMLDKGRTPLSTIQGACEIARKNGLKYIYAGNVHDPANDSTFCSECGKLLIGRDWYELSDWNLLSGKCNSCHTQCAGVYEDTPGTWGRRRQSVNISGI
ncbi:MAG: AmmeMemoRadiSam system radical SAM enzyme [Lentisphaerales bacterium]|nr:AmmeMemoRadiSam system radical SAM enzyme [Lentisphaerales bacterium]